MVHDRVSLRWMANFLHINYRAIGARISEPISSNQGARSPAGIPWEVRNSRGPGRGRSCSLDSCRSSSFTSRGFDAGATGHQANITVRGPVQPGEDHHCQPNWPRGIDGSSGQMFDWVFQWMPDIRLNTILKLAETQLDICFFLFEALQNLENLETSGRP